MYELLILILFGLIIFMNYKKNTKQIGATNCDIENIINTLIRQCSRWAIAATQDKSPIIALLHANYAVGYLWALKDIATDIQIEKVTNINILDFVKKITDIQDKCTKKVSKNCPQFLEHIDVELAKLAKDV